MRDLALEEAIDHVADYSSIAAYGVMSTPPSSSTARWPLSAGCSRRTKPKRSSPESAASKTSLSAARHHSAKGVPSEKETQRILQAYPFRAGAQPLRLLGDERTGCLRNLPKPSVRISPPRITPHLCRANDFE